MPTPGLPPVLRAFRGFEPLSLILHHYVDVDCFLISADQGQWWNLNRRKRPLGLYDLQKKYGAYRASERNLENCFRRVERTKLTQVNRYLDIEDFAVPILRRGRIEAFLVSGTFTRKELTYGRVKALWKEMTGAEDTPSLIEFQEFARVLLETPVLEEPLFSAYREALELFSRLLAGSAEPEEAGRGLWRLLTGVFARRLPHSYFVNWALDRPAREHTPRWGLEVEKWPFLREEIGLTRIPTTVLIAVPRRSSRAMPNAVEEMVRMNSFQRACFLFARTLPETYAGNLGGHGVVFLASQDPALGNLPNRRRMEELAARIHRFASGLWRGPVLVGVGGRVPPGRKLDLSYQQAVSALHKGRKSGRDVVFYAPEPAEAPSGWGSLKSILAEMGARFAGADFSGLGLLRDQFLKTASALSQERPEEMRWHLQYALMELSRSLEKRADLKAPDREAFFQRFSLELERAWTFQDMVLFFGEALQRLADYASNPRRSRGTLALQEIADLIGERRGERLRLSGLAAAAGMSATAFSVKFKAFTGRTFEAYLREKRLEQAERMLRTGSLPVAQVGRACGFPSPSYFIRVFRASMGCPPQEYRRRSWKPSR